MLEPVELEFRIKDADLEQGSQRIVNRIVNMDEETVRLIKRLEALEAKLRELAAQPAMPGFAEQMTDIRAEIDQIGGSLGQMVDGAVTTRLDEVADGMRRVADSAGTFAEGIGEGTQEALEYMKKLRTDLLALGENPESGIMKGLDKDIDSLTKKLAEAGDSGKESTEALTEGFGKVAKSGNMATTVAGSLGKMMSGGLYMLAAQAVAGLAVAIYKAATELSDMEKAVKRVDKGFVDFFKNVNAERASVDMLFNTLRNAEEGTQSYEKAKNTIINNYGEYLRGLSDEIQTLRDVEGAYKAVSVAAIQSARDRAMATSHQSAMDNYTKIESKNLEKIMEAFKKTSPDNYTQLIEELKRSIDSGEGFTQSVLEEIGKQYNFFGNPVRDAIQNIRNARTVLQEESSRIHTLYSPPSSDNAEAIKNRDYWRRELEQLEKAKAALASDEEGSEKWQELTEQIKAARKEVERYDEKAKAALGGRSAGDEIKLQEQINSIVEKLAFEHEKIVLDNEQRILNIEQDGFEKRQKQIDLNYRKGLHNIQEREKELIRASQEIERRQWEMDGKKGTFVPVINSVSQLPKTQQDEIAALYAILEKEREAFVKRLIEDDRELYNSLAINFGDHEQKKKAIAEKWEKEIANLPKEFQEGARSARNRELSELNADFITKSRLWRKYFEEVGDISLTESRRIGDQLREMIMSLADPEVKERLLDMLDEVADRAEQSAGAIERMFGNSKGAGAANLFFGEGDFVSKINSFKTIFSGVENSFKGAEQSSAAVAANSGKSASNMKAAGNNAQGTIAIIDAIIKGINQTINGIREVAEYFYQYSETMNGHASQGTKDFAEFMSEFGAFNDKVNSGWNKLKDGDTMGAITDNIIAWHRGFTWGKRMQEEWKREIEASLRQQLIGEVSINQLYRERYEWAKKIGETTLSYISRNSEELTRQSEASQSDYDRLWERLMKEGTYKSADYIQKNYALGIDWLAKDQHIVEWSSLLGKTFEEIELLAAQGLLSKEGMALYEALKKAKAEGEDLAKRQEELLEEIRETFTGTTYGTLVNSIIDGFKQGKRSAADFADDFEEMMRGAVLNSLKMLSDEGVRNFYEKWASLANDEDGLTEEDIENLRQLWEDTINRIGEQAKDLERITGTSLTSTQDAQKGMFQTMSQQTGTDLLGQFTAIRIHTGNIYDLINNMFLDYGSIAGYLSAIAQNTAATVTELKGFRGDFKRVKEEGFKIL